MADVVSKRKRSEMMSGIHGKDTKPEIQIRSALHTLGYRYKLHAKNMPGTPDLVLPKYNAVIFVHGCFWHLHGCHLFKWPSTRKEFWHEKISGNRQRDEQNVLKLHQKGWRVLVLWECALKGKYRLPFSSVIGLVTDWLESENAEMEISGEMCL
ncbi:DNA mismatch endonuclease Vsr [bacterium]|nr:DNA mismatch endonuclease Vsr [bacterium]